MSDLNLKFIAKFVDNLTGPSRRAMGQFKSDMNNARNGLDRSLATSANLSLVGESATRSGKQIMRALSGPIEVAADYQEAMSAVKAITGSTGEEFNQLNDTARTLGETTTFSASEAAAGMKYLGMAGFEANQIIESMPGVLDLAKAGAVDLGRAADISSDILTGFGLEAADMARVGDVLANTFTSSNTTLEMLGDTMKYVGPLAKKAGWDIESMAAFTGILGNAGIKGSQAGTTLRAMLTRLSAPSKEAASALSMLGVEIENMDGGMRGPAEILKDFETAFSDMGDLEQMSILKTIFGEEPAAGMAEIFSQGEKGFTEFVNRNYEATGTVSKISDTMSDNAKGGMKEWQSAIESLNITIGTELLPAFTDIIRSGTQVVREMSAWAAANPETVKTIAMVTAAVGGLLLIVGPIASMLSGLVATFGMVKFAAVMLKTVALFPLKMAFAAIIPVLKIIAGLLLANPIGLAVTAIAGGAALIMTDWGKVKEFFTDLWGTIKGIFSGVSDWISNAIENPIQTIKNTLGSAWDFIFGGDAEVNTTVNKVKDITSKAEVVSVSSPALSGSKEINVSIPITVKASPGMDEKKLSILISEQVEDAVHRALAGAEV